MSSIIFPDPVPPDTTMFAFARTHAARKSIMAPLRLPNLMRSAGLNGRRANFLMVTRGPQSERAG